MGIFSRRKSKPSKAPDASQTSTHTLRKSDQSTTASTITAGKSSSRSRFSRKGAKNEAPEPLMPSEISMETVPRLIADLEGCTDTSGDKPAKALRILFSLSEHANDSENRKAVVREADGKLVPVLLDFLQRCERGSSEQYLALLVLNNVSIPSENKRWIAIDCGGANVFSRLLCEDPSCHLMAIILVNLTFADAELRKELAREEWSTCVIHSLSYALRVASYTAEEHEARQHLMTADSPRELLRAVIDEDQRTRPALSDLDYNSGSNFRSKDSLVDPAQQIYPETARWCLGALKNLTRPSKDATAARALVDSAIVPFILRFVTVGGSILSNSNREFSENRGSPNNSNSTDSTPPPMDPEDFPEFNNNPATWDTNSTQDAALFVILNLCATPAARESMIAMDTVSILSSIVSYREHGDCDLNEHPMDRHKVVNFQCLKARMAMSYLLGSSGHFGQRRSRYSANHNATRPGDSVLNITEADAELLVELFTNTLHQRGKDGPGGYSASTFFLKGVIFAIRCLLTNSTNQVCFVDAVGSRLNVLLLKAVAQYSVQGTSRVDAESAENACFSLYIQSNHGFQRAFLPGVFGDHDHIAGRGSLTAKILTSYVHSNGVTSAGRHAADQLLLRLRYLIFKGSVAELSSTSKYKPCFLASDFAFDDDLMEATEKIVVEKRSHGARPKRDIFDRPIQRSRASNAAQEGARSSIAVFPCALEAVKQLSYGTTKVRHVDAIDDILIANNIARCANGENSENYNYWWKWQEDAGGRVGRASSPREALASLHKAGSSLSEARENEPVSIFNAFGCGPMMCGLDTTLNEK